MGTSIVTVRDLIRMTALQVGAIAQNEILSADEENDALQLLNDIIDDWNTQSLLIYTVQRNVFSFPTTKQTYTLGPGGDFNIAVRPERIEVAAVSLNTSTNSTELPLPLVSYDQWSQIIVKGVSSPIPSVMWPDYQFPLINCSFWPIPSTTQSVILYMWEGIAQNTSVNTTLALPPGYKRALRYSLELEMGRLYGKPEDQNLLILVGSSMGNIKRINTRMRGQLMKCDSAVLPHKGVYNYYTGQIGR